VHAHRATARRTQKTNGVASVRGGDARVRVVFIVESENKLRRKKCHQKCYVADQQREEILYQILFVEWIISADTRKEKPRRDNTDVSRPCYPR
tara:strand:+ start:105 stop:383 length:279 start_codon:yes stop_codon:yes gene_type:complete